MNIGIVGSDGKWWTPRQRTRAIKKIKDILTDDDYIEHNPFDPGDVFLPTLVTGGCGSINIDERINFCGGVDEWSELVADAIGIPKIIHYSEGFGWEYYQKRNRKILKDSNILFDIEPIWIPVFGKKKYSVDNINFCRWSGGTWTLERAKEKGKEIYLVIID